MVDRLLVAEIVERVVGNGAMDFHKKRNVADVQEEVHPRAPVLPKLVHDDLLVLLVSGRGKRKERRENRNAPD
jgi:hypothetical protein